MAEDSSGETEEGAGVRGVGHDMGGVESLNWLELDGTERLQSRVDKNNCLGRSDWFGQFGSELVAGESADGRRIPGGDGGGYIRTDAVVRTELVAVANNQKIAGERLQAGNSRDRFD